MPNAAMFVQDAVSGLFVPVVSSTKLDNTPNPSAMVVSAFPSVFNAATNQWDLMRGVGTADTASEKGIASAGLKALNTGGTWDRLRGDATTGLIVRPPAAKMQVTAVSGANTAITLTLAAPGAGLFYYIWSIRIVRVSTAALAGAALLAYTSTQLNGAAWSAGNAMAAGDTKIDVDEHFTAPLKSDTANTAVTIIAPAAGAAVSVRIGATFTIGP